jgi:prepilin-type N-terminal cleavage/methylation domain-containing protein
MRILPAGTFPKINPHNDSGGGSGERGLTLIELIVALALLVGLTGAITISLTSYESRHNLDLAFKELITELRLAESMAETSGNETRVYFDTENRSYCIWTKESSDETSSGDDSESESTAISSDTITLPQKITLNAINYPEAPETDEETSETSEATGWPDGSDWIGFHPDRTATAVEIKLQSLSGESRKVQIKMNGWIGEVVDAAD